MRTWYGYMYKLRYLDLPDTVEVRRMTSILGILKKSCVTPSNQKKQPRRDLRCFRGQSVPGTGYGVR